MHSIPAHVLGTIATVVSILMVFLGLPKQIITNYIAKSCKGLDKTLFVLVFFAYTSWSLYGAKLGDKFLIISNVPGVLFTLVILGQMWIYRKWFRWEKGRRNTGYFKMQFLQFSLTRRLTLDCYLLRFPVGSSATVHAEVIPGHRHYRCNFILRPSSAGGQFQGTHVLYDRARLKIFRSDRKHEVSEIKDRTRYVLSFGIAIKRKR